MTLSLFQYFNSSAFLSRKRVQKYCFTTHPPNIRNTFLQTFCRFSRNSLITKRCRTAYFRRSMHETTPLLPYKITRACIAGNASAPMKELTQNLNFTKKRIHSCHRDLTDYKTSENGWQESCHPPYTAASGHYTPLPIHQIFNV